MENKVFFATNPSKALDAIFVEYSSTNAVYIFFGHVLHVFFMLFAANIGVEENGPWSDKTLFSIMWTCSTKFLLLKYSAMSHWRHCILAGLVKCAPAMS